MCTVGAAQGVNQAAQCVGAILIAPLIKHWPTRTVLSGAILFFGLMTTLLLIVDVGTGGAIKSAIGSQTKYGSWNPDAVSSGFFRVLVWKSLNFDCQIFVVWTLAGIAYGMVELIRRVMCGSSFHLDLST